MCKAIGEASKREESLYQEPQKNSRAKTWVSGNYEQLGEGGRRERARTAFPDGQEFRGWRKFPGFSNLVVHLTPSGLPCDLK